MVNSTVFHGIHQNTGLNCWIHSLTVISIVAMSFGTIFIPPEARLQPNFDKFYYNLVEDEIRSKIIPPTEEEMKQSKDLSRLYATGTDSENVLSRMKPKSKKKKKRKDTLSSANLVQDTLSKIMEANEESDEDDMVPLSSSQTLSTEESTKDSSKFFSSNVTESQPPLSPIAEYVSTSIKSPEQYSVSASLMRSTASLASGPTAQQHLYQDIRGIKEKHLAKPHLLSVTETVVHADRQIGGKFHIENTLEPYEEKFQAQPAVSGYNVNTPKMWPSHTQYTSNTTSTVENPYDATIRDHTQTNSFGKSAYSTILRNKLAQEVLASMTTATKKATKTQNDHNSSSIPIDRINSTAESTIATNEIISIPTYTTGQHKTGGRDRMFSIATTESQSLTLDSSMEDSNDRSVNSWSSSIAEQQGMMSKLHGTTATRTTGMPLSPKISGRPCSKSLPLQPLTHTIGLDTATTRHNPYDSITSFNHLTHSHHQHHHTNLVHPSAILHQCQQIPLPTSTILVQQQSTIYPITSHLTSMHPQADVNHSSHYHTQHMIGKHIDWLQASMTSSDQWLPKETKKILSTSSTNNVETMTKPVVSGSAEEYANQLANMIGNKLTFTTTTEKKKSNLDTSMSVLTSNDDASSYLLVASQLADPNNSSKVSSSSTTPSRSRSPSPQTSSKQKKKTFHSTSSLASASQNSSLHGGKTVSGESNRPKNDGSILTGGATKLLAFPNIVNTRNPYRKQHTEYDLTQQYHIRKMVTLPPAMTTTNPDFTGQTKRNQLTSNKKDYLSYQPSMTVSTMSSFNAIRKPVFQTTRTMGGSICGDAEDHRNLNDDSKSRRTLSDNASMTSGLTTASGMNSKGTLVKAKQSASTTSHTRTSTYLNSSQEELVTTMQQITQKQLFSYQIRLMETATLLKSMKDIVQVDTPGLTMIWNFHSACIASSHMNMTPYVISLKQLKSILLQIVPKYCMQNSTSNKSSNLSRLLVAYDSVHTGYIRYIKVSITLFACLEASMIHLAAYFQDDISTKYAHFLIPDYLLPPTDGNSTLKSSVKTTKSKKLTLPMFVYGHDEDAEKKKKHIPSLNNNNTVPSEEHSLSSDTFVATHSPASGGGGMDGRSIGSHSTLPVATNSSSRKTINPSSSTSPRSRSSSPSKSPSRGSSTKRKKKKVAKKTTFFFGSPSSMSSGGTLTNTNTGTVTGTVTDSGTLGKSQDEVVSKGYSTMNHSSGSLSGNTIGEHGTVYSNVCDSMINAQRKITENEWKTYRGDVLFLRFFHQLYAQCCNTTTHTIAMTVKKSHATLKIDPLESLRQAAQLGHQTTTSITGTQSMAEELEKANASEERMKLEDLMELFTGCVMSTHDYSAMEKLLLPVQHLLFVQGLLHHESNYHVQRAERDLSGNTIASTVSTHGSLPESTVASSTWMAPSSEGMQDGNSTIATRSMVGDGSVTTSGSSSSSTQSGSSSSQRMKGTKSSSVLQHIPDVNEVQKILRAPFLKQYYPTVYITASELVEALLQYPDTLREFIRQLRNYRDLARPYLYEGCEDAVEESMTQMTASHANMMKI